LKMTLRENRLRSGEDRKRRYEIKLVLEIRWKVYRTAYASRSRCARLSENILVILGGLVFVLGAQTNGKNILMAQEFVTTNEIQVGSKIVRIKLLNPFPKIGRKKSAVLKIAMKPKDARIEFHIVSPDG